MQSSLLLKHVLHTVRVGLCTVTINLVLPLSKAAICTSQKWMQKTQWHRSTLCIMRTNLHAHARIANIRMLRYDRFLPDTFQFTSQPTIGGILSETLTASQQRPQNKRVPRLKNRSTTTFQLRHHTLNIATCTSFLKLLSTIFILMLQVNVVLILHYRQVSFYKRSDKSALPRTCAVVSNCAITQDFRDKQVMGNVWFSCQCRWTRPLCICTCNSAFNYTGTYRSYLVIEFQYIRLLM
jgi:hypothetical protein